MLMNSVGSFADDNEVCHIYLMLMQKKIIGRQNKHILCMCATITVLIHTVHCCCW